MLQEREALSRLDLQGKSHQVSQLLQQLEQFLRQTLWFIFLLKGAGYHRLIKTASSWTRLLLFLSVSGKAVAPVKQFKWTGRGFSVSGTAAAFYGLSRLNRRILPSCPAWLLTQDTACYGGDILTVSFPLRLTVPGRPTKTPDRRHPPGRRTWPESDLIVTESTIIYQEPAANCGGFLIRMNYLHYVNVLIKKRFVVLDICNL